MHKRTGFLFVSMGAVLILSALLLLLYNTYEDRRAGQEAALVLDHMQAAIGAQGNEQSETADRPQAADRPKAQPEGKSEASLSGLSTVVIDGYAYIGYLSIPDLQLQLPVMWEWDYKRLKIAPCRQMGSVDTGDLVIAAHNYKTHFGHLSKLQTGAAICFTDVEGNISRYTLEKLETVSSDAVDVVQDSEYELVLYTCTPGGASRVAAFCSLASEGMRD